MVRNVFLGWFAAATLLTGTIRAVEPSTAAQDRAVRYQREVRTALVERGWRITRDEAGKLTAERRRKIQEGTSEFLIGENVDARARLEISFRADGTNRAVPSARASLCYYNALTPDNVGQTIYPPFALRDPKLTREYRDILAEADSHLADGSRKVAMK